MTALLAPRHAALKRTPLYDLHVQRRADGAIRGLRNAYPVSLGIMKEHLHTRAHAGLFDVSHMGQIALRPRNGSMADVASALERLVPVDVAWACGRATALRVFYERRMAASSTI